MKSLPTALGLFKTSPAGMVGSYDAHKRATKNPATFLKTMVRQDILQCVIVSMVGQP